MNQNKILPILITPQHIYFYIVMQQYFINDKILPQEHVFFFWERIKSVQTYFFSFFIRYR